MPIERLLFMLDGLRRHWFLLLLPIIIALPLAYAVVKLVPKSFEAKSTILMTSANRGLEGPGGSAGAPRHVTIEQIGVLDAWLKSDHVLGELLPQLTDEPLSGSPEERGILIHILRSSLTLELIGAAVLEIRLTGPKAHGLGRKLEIIVARLLDGVLNPEAGILSAPQMLIARRSEAVAEAERALDQAIAAARLEQPAAMKANLRTLHDLKRSGGTTDAAQQLTEARASIAADPEVVRQLERLYGTLEEARLLFEETRERAGSASGGYVRVFDAPERLTLVGRPRDPLIGKSPGRKYAVAIMLLAGLVSVGLVGVMVLLDPRLRVGEDFELVANLPVVARVGKAPELR